MTRSRQGILKGSPGEAYARWEVPAVGGDLLHAPHTEAQQSKPVTAEELESLQRKAYEEGFAAGRSDGFAQGQREGREAAEAERRAQVQRLQAILHCLAVPLESLDAEVEQSLVALVVAIARQVVRSELATRPEQILTLVRESIGALPVAARNVRLYLHPDDFSLVRETLSEELEQVRWVMREDTSLARGGCRVESDSSRIDASVEHRLATVIAQVLDVEGSEVLIDAS